MHLVSALNDLYGNTPPVGKTHIIAIDGPAGAGKTTLANEIFQAMSTKYSIEVIHMDDLYNGWQDALGDELTALLSSIIDSQKNMNTFKIPIFDWVNYSFTSVRELKPPQILILEGVGSARSCVREFTMATIWIEVDRALGIQRVLARDGEEIETHMKQWLIDQEIYFTTDKTRESADFILST